MESHERILKKGVWFSLIRENNSTLYKDNLINKLGLTKLILGNKNLSLKKL